MTKNKMKKNYIYILILIFIFMFGINSHVYANNEDYVKGLYKDLLNRKIDPAGAQTWIGGLDSGKFTREFVKNEILNSAEYRQKHGNVPSVNKPKKVSKFKKFRKRVKKNFKRITNKIRGKKNKDGVKTGNLDDLLNNSGTGNIKDGSLPFKDQKIRIAKGRDPILPMPVTVKLTGASFGNGLFSVSVEGEIPWAPDPRWGGNDPAIANVQFITQQPNGEWVQVWSEFITKNQMLCNGGKPFRGRNAVVKSGQKIWVCVGTPNEKSYRSPTAPGGERSNFIELVYP